MTVLIAKYKINKKYKKTKKPKTDLDTWSIMKDDFSKFYILCLYVTNSFSLVCVALPWSPNLIL